MRTVTVTDCWQSLYPYLVRLPAELQVYTASDENKVKLNPMTEEQRGKVLGGTRHLLFSNSEKVGDLKDKHGKIYHVFSIRHEAIPHRRVYYCFPEDVVEHRIYEEPSDGTWSAI